MAGCQIKGCPVVSDNQTNAAATKSHSWAVLRPLTWETKQTKQECPRVTSVHLESFDYINKRLEKNIKWKP